MSTIAAWLSLTDMKLPAADVCVEPKFIGRLKDHDYKESVLWEVENCEDWYPFAIDAAFRMNIFYVNINRKSPSHGKINCMTQYAEDAKFGPSTREWPESHYLTPKGGVGHKCADSVRFPKIEIKKSPGTHAELQAAVQLVSMSTLPSEHSFANIYTSSCSEKDPPLALPIYEALDTIWNEITKLPNSKKVLMSLSTGRIAVMLPAAMIPGLPAGFYDCIDDSDAESRLYASTPETDADRVTAIRIVAKVANTVSPSWMRIWPSRVELCRWMLARIENVATNGWKKFAKEFSIR